MDDGDTTSNISSLADIPPYLKDQYTPLGDVFQAHTSILPSRKSPASNSEAVIRSLKALQEKIRSLEVERVAAADRFKVLSQQTNTVPIVTTTTRSVPTSSIGTTTEPVREARLEPPSMDMPDIGTTPHLRDTTPHTHTGLKFRLDSLDERLAQQAQELDAMQQRLRLADISSTHYPHTPTQARSQGECKCSTTEKKLRSLEQGVSYLKEAQTRTKEKVDELETCIESSPRGRAEPCDPVDGGRWAATQTKRKTKPKLKKGKVAPRRVQSAPTPSGDVALKCLPHPLPGVHYRLNMRDVPFILASSTAPSHSVSVNYQQVLSLMKSHNHILCGAAALSSKKKTSKAKRKSVKRGISEEELEVLLSGLEEEYGALTFEHQALTQHLDNNAATQKPRVKASLELQLKHLEEQLESKAEQIQIVSKQLTSSHTTKRDGPKKTASPVVALLNECADHTSGEASVPEDTQTQRCFLKKMKALQSTLQRDDLNWK